MKTQSIYYKDVHNPTTAELYAVLLDNLAIVDLKFFNTRFSMCNNTVDLNACVDCPFSHHSISFCYLDSDTHIRPVITLLQQSHPELFL